MVQISQINELDSFAGCSLHQIPESFCWEKKIKLASCNREFLFLLTIMMTATSMMLVATTSFVFVVLAMMTVFLLAFARFSGNTRVVTFARVWTRTFFVMFFQVAHVRPGKNSTSATHLKKKIMFNLAIKEKFITYIWKVHWPHKSDQVVLLMDPTVLADLAQVIVRAIQAFEPRAYDRMHLAGIASDMFMHISCTWSFFFRNHVELDHSQLTDHQL